PSSFSGLFSQCAVINLLVRPHVRVWVAGNGIVFPVELARPLIVRRLTVLIGTVHGNFHVVAGSLIDNRVILRYPWGELGFGLVQLPSAHLRVGGKTHCRSEKAKRQS